MKEFFGKAVLSMAAQGGLLHGAVQQTEKNFFSGGRDVGADGRKPCHCKWYRVRRRKEGGGSEWRRCVGADRLQLRNGWIYVNLRDKTFRADADGGGAPAVLCAFYGAAWPGS